MKLVRVTAPLGIFFREKIRTLGVPDGVIDHASARGTAVHSACAAYALGLWIPPMSAEIQGYFDSFKAWFDKYVSKVYFVEKEFIDHALGIIGHPDIGCQLIDGRNLVIDYKTPTGVARSWGPQLAAYLHLARQDRRYDGGMVLQPRKDGRPAKAVHYNYADSDFAVYLSALNCYRHFNQEEK